MAKKIHLLGGVAAIAMAAGGAPAWAQSPSGSPSSATSTAPAGVQSGGAQAGGADTSANPSPASSNVSEVVVTGFRASLQSAERIKENAGQVVDSIVASDIGKLPDINTAEALQRISGVQVNRDYGEGATVTIRGLSQVETLLNGREVFSAAGTREFNFEFLPAELLAGIDVYKTQSPDLIEGGLGGTIDVRTRKPFDFKGFTFSGSAFGNYGSLQQDAEPQVSALISDRWHTGMGDVGALLSVSYQERAFRENYIGAGAPLCYGTATTSTTGGPSTCSSYIGPNGFYNPTYTGLRKRTGVDGVLQWRPTQDLELYMEASYVEFANQFWDYGSYPFDGAKPTPYLSGAPTLYPNSNIVESANFTNVPTNFLGINRDVIDEDKSIALGGRWQRDRLTLKFDISYLDTSENLYYNELDLQAKLPNYSFNTNGSPPSETYSGVDLTNPANYKFGGLTDSINHWGGREAAYQGDGDYRLDFGPLKDFAFGFRYADTGDTLLPVRYFNGNPAPGATAATYPSLVQQTPVGAAFPGASTINGYLNVNPYTLGNLGGVFSTLGLTGYPPAIQTQGIFKIDEAVTEGYFKLNFATHLLVPIDGNVGVRVTSTDDNVNGTQTTNTNGTLVYTPITRQNSYTDALPSVNVRAHLTDDLFLRLAAYKSLTRPELSNLNPSLSLLPANLTATVGNYKLQPYTATNYDATLEWYFSRTGNFYGDVFYKTVKGFFITETLQELINGQNYLVSEPTNAGLGHVGGGELGYQQFYTFLPGLLSGLGFQGNITYVDSSAPTSVAGFVAPLPNLSRLSYNAVGIYEKGPFSARLAWVYRSHFVQSIGVAAGVGVVPTSSQGYGELDAAVNYDINSHLTVTLEGSNLSDTKRQTYVGSILSPGATYRDDVQALFGVRFKF